MNSQKRFSKGATLKISLTTYVRKQLKIIKHILMIIKKTFSSTRICN